MAQEVLPCPDLSITHARRWMETREISQKGFQSWRCYGLIWGPHMQNDDNNDDDQVRYKKIKRVNARFLSSIRARISFCMLSGRGGKACTRKKWGGKRCDWTAYADSHEVKCHFSRAAGAHSSDTGWHQAGSTATRVPLLAGAVWKHKERLMQEEGRTDRGPAKHRRGAAMWDTEQKVVCGRRLTCLTLGRMSGG